MSYQHQYDSSDTLPTTNGTSVNGYTSKKKNSCLVFTTISACILALVLCARTLISPAVHIPSGTDDKEKHAATGGQDAGVAKAKSRKRIYDEYGRYIVEDYDAKPTFSDFLPGVAGIYGKPLWSFYVNRGQGIASFGTKSKDFPIMEFNSANKAYQNTALLGFRTFIHGTRNVHSFLTEPFTPTKTRFQGIPDQFSMLPKRYMYVGANEMQIRETDLTNKIETNVTYFVLPEEDFVAFVRRTTISNLDGQEPLTVSVLDGLARMEPAGGKLNDYLKDMGQTLEGFMGVYRAHEDTLTMPFYRMSTEPGDTASVKIEEEGHYCLSFIESTSSALLPIVYDPSKIFGEDTLLLHPVGLQTKTISDIIADPQYGFAKIPSAFAAVDSVTIKPGDSITISSFYGKTSHIMDVPVISRRITQGGFVQYKFTRAREIIQQITASVETKTGNHLFDGHVKQMFMDNSLRGGTPFILGEEDDQARMSNADEDKRLKVYHLFSRIHGDLERDYNDFVLDPTYFSQGPGNFRDVAQNRRNDVIFSPRIGSFNVKMFLSYIQADGYEPLSVEAAVFLIKDKDVCDDIATRAVGHADGHRAQREALSDILNSGPIRPGQLFSLMESQNIELIMGRSDFVDMIAAAAEYFPMGEFKDGYWSDHWTYYMDLIETYLSIYPDGEEALMYNENLPYFYSPAYTRPRSEKYVLSLTYDASGQHVRQLDATVKDKEKRKAQKIFIDELTGWYKIDGYWQHDKSGNMFTSSPIAKLFLLGTLKFATRDAYGMGVEYEGGKPGWNDAMNGLVGMVGSGMPETFELEVLLLYVKSVLQKYQRPLVVPTELVSLIDCITSALDALDHSGYEDSQSLDSKVPAALFEYWDAVASAREQYRRDTRLTFTGETKQLGVESTISMLDRWIAQLELGKARAIIIGSHGRGDNGTLGITPTYFSYNVDEWTLTGKRNKEGHPLVTPNAMSVGTFPLFLEGPVRMMKTVDGDKALDIYNKVKVSGLRDEALGMYAISASLAGQSFDMGRMMAFSPGWLENQSVWMHMSYKYYLELIRRGLFVQFYTEMISGGMLPFMKPDVYGRSLMECSSFIASSAFADPAVQGRGFLARLSGSTAEFLSMWALMMIGPEPFFLDEQTKELRMQLVPALPLWLFQGDSTVQNDNTVQSDTMSEALKQSDNLTLSFKLFTSINVTYHNTRKTNLFRVKPEKYHVGLRDGSKLYVDGASVPPDLADKIRRVVFVDSIDVYF